MNRSRIVMRSAVVACLFLALTAGTSYAYLDPGAGSYLLQLALAALLGILLSVRIFWKKIQAFLARLLSPVDAGDRSGPQAGGEERQGDD